MFNPNELVLEKVRVVEEYDPATNELTGRYTQIEDPSLKTSADAQEVTDAMGSTVATFYKAQKGEFSFNNSFFSLDLAASQYGTEKILAGASKKILTPVSEVIAVASDHTVTLKYVPVGTTGAEVKYVKVINENNTFGDTYEVAATAGEGKFTIEAATKKITLPASVTSGRVFVNYEKESTEAAQVTKRTDSTPGVKTLIIHAIFHEICNTNTVYAGIIRCPRAQINPASTEISLKPDGKHAATYILQKDYCADESVLFDVIISKD